MWRCLRASASHTAPQVDEADADDDATPGGDDGARSSAGTAGDEKLTPDEIKRRILARKGSSKKTRKPAAAGAAAAPKTKTQRTWTVEAGGKVKNAAALNKSRAGDEDASGGVEVGSQRVAAYNLELEVSSDEDEDDDDTNNVNNNNNNNSGEPVKRGFFGNLLRGLTGRTLDAGDLEPVLAGLQDHLVKKNVASDVAKQLCLSVQSSLMGKHLGSLASVSSTVTDALRVALTKILTPKRKIDILRDVEVANAEGRPYTAVFVGINGVGKSTNLAKVASWLLSNQKKVLIAACDTFRSGAVEQLAVHCRNLDVPLFQQGYGNDAASIAQLAVRQVGVCVCCERKRASVYGCV